MADAIDLKFAETAKAALERTAQAPAIKAASDPGPWYLVRAIGRSDQVALDWLKRLSIETYYPQTTQLRPLARKRLSAAQRRAGVQIMRLQLEPLLPRYIFARLQMCALDRRQIFACAGIGGIAYANNGLAPIRVSDAQIERIRAREVDGWIPESDRLHLIFDVGDPVRVTEGPFASFSGIVETSIGDLDANERIKIALDIFGRATTVELDTWQVEKL